MKALILIASLLALILGLTSAVATTCNKDYYCPAYEFCDESNPDSYGMAQCTAISYIGCNGTDLNCTGNSDCSNKGTGYCYTKAGESYGICLSSGSVASRSTCQLDIDCGSDVCVEGICTPGDIGRSIRQCTSDSGCASGTTCVHGFCRATANIGGYCLKNADCHSTVLTILSTLICENNVCVSCPSDGGYSGQSPTYPSYAAWFLTPIGSGYYCNVTNRPKCSLAYFYPSYSETTSQVAPEILPKRGENDPCADDGCCVSGDCDPLTHKCVMADGYPIGGGNDSIKFCSNSSYGYSLMTNWFDHASSSSDYPNTTFFATFYGYNPSTFFALNLNSAIGASLHYVGERHLVSGRYDMFSLFADNSTGDVCWFKQLGIQIFWHCIPNCVTPGSLNQLTGGGECSDTANTAHVTTGCEVATDIVCHDSNMAVFATTHAAVISLGSVTSNTFSNFDVYSAIDGAIFGWDGATAHDFQDLNQILTSPYYNIGLGRSQTSVYNNLYYYIISAWTPYGPTSHINPPITISPTATQDYACCDPNNGNADCETLYSPGWTCDANKVCQPPGVGNITTGLTVLQLTSTDPAIATGHICTSKTYTFSLDVLDAYSGNRILSPMGTIILTTDAGTIMPTSCTSLPCVFTLTTPGTATPKLKLHFTYSGNSQYQKNGGNSYFNVSSTCHLVTIRVYDASKSTITWLPYVTVTTNLTQYLGTSSLTNFEGKLSIGGLSYSPFTVNLSKAGYTSAQFTIEVTDLDQPYSIALPLYPTSVPVVIPPPNNALLTLPPTDVGEVTNGFLKIAFAFFAWPFTWFLLIITFIIGLVVVRHLLLGALG